MELSKEFRERFVKTLQGKDYVLYGGLLELARQRGLTRIDTRVIQIPSQDNGMAGGWRQRLKLMTGCLRK